MGIPAIPTKRESQNPVPVSAVRRNPHPLDMSVLSKEKQKGAVSEFLKKVSGCRDLVHAGMAIWVHRSERIDGATPLPSSVANSKGL